MAFKITTSQGIGDQCIQEALDSLPNSPAFVILVATVQVSSQALRLAAVARFPDTCIHIATSCLGAMTESEIHLEGPIVVAAAFTDDEGAYGTAAAAQVSGEEAQLATSLLERAQLDADRPGELPALVWLNAAPGTEEAIISALDRHFDGQVPIYGGSSADNDISGQWWVSDSTGVIPNGVVLSVLYPEAEVLHAFHSGYEPTAKSGRVTKANGRVLVEIDGRPAANVYNEWTQGAMDAHLNGANILGASTMYPLAVEVGRVNGVPYHRLIHPETIRNDGAITLFAEAQTGTQLMLMRGEESSLLTRAGRVAKAAIASDDGGLEDLAGGFVVYCAGCMLSVQSKMKEVHTSLTDTLPNIPFLGQFSFGEQGTFPNGETCHGNLMISTVLFRALS